MMLQWRALFLILVKAVVLLLIGNPNNPSKLKGDIQEIEHDDQNKAGHEHGNGPKDPQKQREREVEGTEAQGPEIAASVDSVGNILCCEIMMLVMR